MRCNALLPLIGLVQVYLVGCAAIPQVGDRFEIIDKTTAHRDLSSYDKALYYGGKRGDVATIQAMLNSGELFDLSPGTTGVITSFPRPIMHDSSSGNLNDWSHDVAYVQIDKPARTAVLSVRQKSVKVIKSEKPTGK